MACFYAPNGQLSNLYEETKNVYGEEVAEKIWRYVRTPEFINKFGDWQSASKELSLYPKNSFEYQNVLESYSNISSFVDENFEPKLLYFNDTVDKPFNNELKRFINNDDIKNIATSITPRTIKKARLTTMTYGSDTELNLNEKLKKGFLKDFNFDVKEYDSIKESLGYNNTQMVDLVSKFIALEKGAGLEKSTAYVAYKLLGKKNDKLKSELHFRINSWDKYQELYKKYKKEIYQDRGFIENKTEWRKLIREKIIADFLSETIVDYYNDPVEFKRSNSRKWTQNDFTRFEKFIRWLRNLFTTKKRSFDRLKNISYEIAEEVLNNNYDIYDYKLDENQVQKYYKETIDKDPFAKKIVEYHQSKGIVLTGSLALRYAGSVFRTEEESLHDLDFVVPYEIVRNPENKKVMNDILRYQGIDIDFSSDMTLKFIENFNWFKDFKEQYPNYKILNGFYGSEHSQFESFTLTGVIDGEYYQEDGSHKITKKDGTVITVPHKKGDYIADTGYIIDHFIRLKPKQEEHENYFKLWKEIMIAKLLMGREKDFIDFKHFIPFIKSKDTFNFYYPDWVFSERMESKKMTTDNIIKKARTSEIEEVFDSNPELANQVYEALGFNSLKNNEAIITEIAKDRWKITATNETWKKIAQGRVKNMGSLKDDSFKVKELIKSISEKGYDISQETKSGSVMLGARYRDNFLDLKDGKHRAVALGILFPNNTRTIEFTKEADFTWDKKDAVEELKQFNIELVPVIEKQITPQQKQQALQQYSQYLDSIFPDVILPIGTSGSGKSTFIKSLPQKNLVVIEPDAMRVEFTGDINDKSKDKEIYEEAAKRAVAAIKQGKQVVFDTTNLTKDKRLPFIEVIKKEIPNANIQYKLMELNPELAKQRIKAQIARGENRANVPDSTIDRHAESYKQMLVDIKSEPITEFKELGNKQDIEGFKNFVSGRPTTQPTVQPTEVKEGVQELFESNPELANQVYEALGFKQTVTQDDKSYYRGQIEKPTIDKNGNLVLYAREDELYKRAGLKSKGVSMTDDLQSAIEYGNGQLEVALNLASETYDYEKESETLSENGYYLIQIPKNISNEIVKEAGEVKVIGDKIIIPKGQYKIEQVVDDIEQITFQQKQQALQLYSQYISTIFPDSQVKDIVYHGSPNKNIDKIEKGIKTSAYTEEGIYASSEKRVADVYGKRKNGKTYSVLVNATRPFLSDGNNLNFETISKDKIDNLINENYDSVIYNQPAFGNKKEIKNAEIVIFNPEQIHVLGSKDDIEGFKEFTKGQSIKKGRFTEIEYTPDNLTKENMPENGVFVFGSNNKGNHGSGAAKFAVTEFGAIKGKATGEQGKAYAIRTKMYENGKLTKFNNLTEEGKKEMNRMTITDISKLITVDAIKNPDKKYYVTEIGTKLAGRTVEDMRSIFEQINDQFPIPKNVILPESFEVRDEIIESETNIPKSETKINIYSTDKNGFQQLSNILNGPVKAFIDGKELTFKTVEHLYQVKKALFAGDRVTADKIYTANTGWDAQKLGSQRSGGISWKVYSPQDWDKISALELESSMRLSFHQNKNMRDLLVSTGNATLTHKKEGINLGRSEKLFPEILESIRNDINSNKELILNFDDLIEFNNDRRKEILSNFANKHKMTEVDAKSYINEALKNKDRNKVINILKECY